MNEMCKINMREYLIKIQRLAYNSPMPKPKENLSPGLIGNVQEMEMAEDIDYRHEDNEKFVREIYKKQSTFQLEIVDRLLAMLSSTDLKKQANDFFVGLYPDGKYLRLREETAIKDRFLHMDLEGRGFIKNLYSRTADVPDVEGPFTTQIIIANFQFDHSKLEKELESLKIDLEHKIHVRTGEKLAFEKEHLEFGSVNVPFEGGQGKMMQQLLDARKEYVGAQVMTSGGTITAGRLRTVGGYQKDTFRTALRHCRAKLKRFEKAKLKVEIANTSRGKGLYQLIVHYP